MFKGLTQRAQRVLTVLAPEEMRKFNSSEIEPEHIMIALLKDGEGVAVRALQKIKVNISEMQMELEIYVMETVETEKNGRRIILHRTGENGCLRSLPRRPKNWAMNISGQSIFLWLRPANRTV